MNADGKELEVKFYLNFPFGFESWLQSVGAKVNAARCFESNIRFDRSDGSLAQNHQILRLRKDRNTVVTFKGPAEDESGVTVRQELEIQANNYDMAYQFLVALGFQPGVKYEKYRVTYDLDDTTVTIDELPFGHFCEIEGYSPQAVMAVTKKLGLEWPARIRSGYLSLFESLKAKKGWTMPDLTFNLFRGLTVTAEDLGVQAADVCAGARGQ
jgi:adenylyl cyclase CyaB, putative